MNIFKNWGSLLAQKLQDLQHGAGQPATQPTADEVAPQPVAQPQQPKDDEAGGSPAQTSAPAQTRVFGNIFAVLGALALVLSIAFSFSLAVSPDLEMGAATAVVILITAACFVLAKRISK